MRFEAFCGPFAKTRSRTFNAEDTINLYLEPSQSGTPRSRAALYGTPGTVYFAQFGNGTGRGLFSQDGRVFGIAGTQFGELESTGAIVNTGTVADDGEMATFSSNGQGGFQVFVTAGGLGYVFDLNADTLTQIADAEFPANVTMGAYFEGYSVALVGESSQFHISALMDSTDWDGLDIYQRNIGSDDFVAMVQNHRELWFLGSRTSLVYVNTGDASTPLQPIPGVLIQQGCLAKWTAKRLDNAVAWLGQDEQGRAIVYIANGYTPQRVSTAAVEHYLAQSDDLENARAFTLQIEGHLWYGLYVSDLDETLTYDVSNGEWFKLAWWRPDLAEWTPHPAVAACAAFGQPLIQDRQSPAVYALSMAKFDDDIVVAA